MSLFATIRSTDRSSLDRERSADVVEPSPSEPVEASLPRHLLVSLAGITADVTSLQHAHAEEPQLHAALGTILRRLDGLVDSIYQRSAHRAASSVHRAGIAAVSASPVLAGVPDGLSDTSNVARLAEGRTRPLTDHAS